MEFHTNAAYLSFAELNSQHFVSHQYPEKAAPAPVTDPWMETMFDRCDSITSLPTDPRIGAAAPYVTETPQITQATQTPNLYALPEPPWPYPGQQPANPPEFECWFPLAPVPCTPVIPGLLLL